MKPRASSRKSEPSDIILPPEQPDPPPAILPAPDRPAGFVPPPFTLDDLEARRAWLWMLIFNIFQNRAASAEKLDYRFALHLSELLGLNAPVDEKKSIKVDALGEFLDGLSVEAFAEYKRQGEPR
ncbi:hypothetical protein [Geminicoccus roseus]|uniref:hypothetical protein n=1 Tax=Geminicoccus roseus TaxID=404900 RepID=UPI000481CAA4|nr:hypothetical protein [Geminicoccus roseus]